MQQGQRIQVMGHRGCATHYPENTLAAIRGCAPHVDAVEIDVRRCASGEIVVFHDETVDRLTEGDGRVDEHAFADLPPVAVDGATEPIPTLAEALDALPDGTGVNVELKHAGMADEVAALLRAVDDAMVSSFEAAALEPFQEEPIPTAYLFGEGFAAGLDTAEGLDCAFIHPHYAETDAERIEQAHDRGLGVNVWTVPNEREVKRLRDAGVEGVIVDSWTIVPGGVY